MGLTKRLFIKIIPGKTFLDKLSGTTKVRFFLLLILLLIVSWDLRVLLAVSVLGVIGMISVKPNWPLIRGLTVKALLYFIGNVVCPVCTFYEVYVHLPDLTVLYPVYYTK